jgi:pimeloyl-ACP methyl ester carboxylesterase
MATAYFGTTGVARLRDGRCITCAAVGPDDGFPIVFDPSDISVPVMVWHGRKDCLVPLAHTLRLAAVIPTSTAHVEPAAGHFFFCQRLTSILEAPVSITDSALGLNDSAFARAA